MGFFPGGGGVPKTRTINMKPADVKSSTYIDFDVKNNDQDLKLKAGDFVRISKCKNIFVVRYTK